METKFDFSDKPQDASKKQASTLNLAYLRQLFDITKGTDYATTLEAVRQDIPFRGATAWVLICSIFIACIGLNTDSTAVVIGAMLIAPLMGPVLGMGVGLAINDLDMIKSATQNFIVMVLLSAFTATVFFLFFPLQQESSELLARTQPDIRDVFIAFFGGAALAIARTKKGAIASVIFGVAIATALMPPLCTIGYGIAVGNLRYALGALYLFFINATFIAFASFVVVKLLRFPMIHYADSKRRRFIVRVVSFFALLVMIPAGVTFVNALGENAFRKQANAYLDTHVSILPYGDYLVSSAAIQYNRKSDSQLLLNPLGLVQIDSVTMRVLEQKLTNYDKLHDVKLIVFSKEKE
jgi:uncharacterized hydrophobic protein (TIGR00271 family)